MAEAQGAFLQTPVIQAAGEMMERRNSGKLDIYKRTKPEVYGLFFKTKHRRGVMANAFF